jgi:hypothetical protein
LYCLGAMIFVTITFSCCYVLCCVILPLDLLTQLYDARSLLKRTLHTSPMIVVFEPSLIFDNSL